MTRQRLILAGVALLALAVSFGAGRYSRPARVVTADKVRTEVQYRDRVVTQVQHDVQTVHDVATRTVTVTKWAKAPDGSPVVTQETHAERQDGSRTNVRNQATQERASEAQATTVTLHTREVVDERPNWSATAMVGGQLGGRRLFEVAPGVVVGVALERRILGPVSAGLWATSGMAGGISVRVDW